MGICLILTSSIGAFKMYNPRFEDDFFKNITQKYRSIYLKFLVRNIGLFADSEKNDKRQQFLLFLISRESLELVRKNGPVILYDDNNLNEA